MQVGAAPLEEFSGGVDVFADGFGNHCCHQWGRFAVVLGVELEWWVHQRILRELVFVIVVGLIGVGLVRVVGVG